MTEVSKFRGRAIGQFTALLFLSGLLFPSESVADMGSLETCPALHQPNNACFVSHC